MKFKERKDVSDACAVFQITFACREAIEDGCTHHLVHKPGNSLTVFIGNRRQWLVNESLAAMGTKSPEGFGLDLTYTTRVETKVISKLPELPTRKVYASH